MKTAETAASSAQNKSKRWMARIDNRQILEGMEWVLRTGIRRQDLPDGYLRAAR